MMQIESSFGCAAHGSLSCAMKNSARYPAMSALTCVLAWILLPMAFASSMQAQTAGASQSAQPAQSTNAQPAAPAATETPQPRNHDRRRAARLYLAASKLFMDEHYEDAMKDYAEAAKLDSTNLNYRLAINVARSHAVTALIQIAAKDRLRGDAEGTRAALTHALKLDPNNVEATQHLYELGDDAIRGQPKRLYEQPAGAIDDVVTLAPAAGLRSFHIRADQRQIIQQVFHAYGIDATMDDSVQALPVQLDIDGAGFEAATRALALVTNTFYIPLDEHRVVLARDTQANRQEFTRQEMETVYLSSLKPDEITEVANLAKQVFNIQQAVPEPSAN
ncbi:MAG: hypothetical protein P4L92_18310, partial [Rudaea sp.]|nr:hypothetical protein [Rudaea sp.]